MTLLFLTTFLKTHLQLFNQLFWCRSLCFRHRALFFVSQEGKYQNLTWLSNIPYWFKENVSWRRIQEMIFKQRGRLCRIGGCRSTVVSSNPALFNVEVRPTTSLTILKLGTTLKHLRANFGATLKKTFSQLWDNCQIWGELDKKPLYSLQFPLRSRFVAPPILVRSLQLS